MIKFFFSCSKSKTNLKKCLQFTFGNLKVFQIKLKKKIKHSLAVKSNVILTKKFYLKDAHFCIINLTA